MTDNGSAVTVALGMFATLAAFALVVLLSAPWYERTIIPGGGDPPNTATFDAWLVFEVIDIVILIGALVALVALWLRKFLVAIAASAVVLAVIVYRLIDMPFEEFYEAIPNVTFGPTWGAWTAAATAVCLLAICVIALLGRHSSAG
jgi:hypothetical protein